MTFHLNIVDIPQPLTHLVSQLEDSKPIILNREGEEVAALITMRDLNLFNRLVEAEEDRIDQAEAAKVLATTNEEDWIPFENIKAELSL